MNVTVSTSEPQKPRPEGPHLQWAMISGSIEKNAPAFCSTHQPAMGPTIPLRSCFFLGAVGQ